MLEQTPLGQNFHDLLPDYVNGFLDADDQAWVEQFIRDNPQAELELLFLRKAKAVMNSAVSPIPLEEAVLDFRARLDEQRRLKAQNQKPNIEPALPRARPSSVMPDAPWWSRLWLPLPIPAPILATLLIVVVAPYIWMGQRTDVPGLEENNAGYRGIAQNPSVPCAQQHRIRLVFAKQARLEDVSVLLGKLGGAVVDGPTVAGEYWVRVPTASSLQDAASTLKAQPWVDDVWVPPADSTLGCR